MARKSSPHVNRNEVRVFVPAPHFSLFETERAGKPAVVVVNDALFEFPATEIFPWQLCVTICGDGSMTSEESDVLFAISDEIESVTLRGRTSQGSENALFIGRVSIGTVRELLFQVHDPEVANDSLQNLLQSRTWPREWRYEMKGDSEWSHASGLLRLVTRPSSTTATH